MAVDFALLAPVPLIHLESALRLPSQQPYIAFGSMKWDLFRDIDAERGERPVPALIYPSHDLDAAEFHYNVSWAGWYVGSTGDQLQKFADEKAGRRPSSALNDEKDTPSYWAVFWRVADLQRLPAQQHVEIRELNKYRTGDGRQNAPPRGPERILIPFPFPLPPPRRGA